MKVILNQTVPKVGKEGQVVSVADGFARNYLFPRGLAILADKNQVKALERRLAKIASQSAEAVAGAEATKVSLQGQRVRIAGKVGADTTRLFGAVTSQDVANAIQAQLGMTIDRKQIALIEPIKRLGEHQVLLDLHRDVDAHLIVEVYNPDTEPVASPEA